MPKQTYTIARLERGGTTFEILVNPDNALKYKMGEKVPLSKIIIYEEVYKDWKKGTRASESELKKAFGATDFMKIAERILEQGELQVTAEQRRKLIEEKRRQIIDFISRNAIDPRTNMPHPAQRIELALEEIGVSIDPFVDAQQQAMKVIERLSRVLPLKIGMMRVKIRMPGEFVGQAYGIVRSMGKILHEEWRGDGSWVCEAELPTGLHTELIEKLNKLCSGRVEVTPVS
ncbi:MAG: ribosome assembly factor SBDS [Aigarchaeota archaeon]|nr:ribosome assembly factor SBDS [Candidatus Pelearchaeum maunauluense]